MSPSQTLAKNDERRRHVRLPTRQGAELFLGAGQGSHVCMVLDRSLGGVQIDLGEKIDLPDTMIIQFSDEASQLVRRCWAAGTRAGMEFVGTPTHTGPNGSDRFSKTAFNKQLLKPGNLTALASQVASALQQIEFAIRDFLDVGHEEDAAFFSEIGSRVGGGYRHKVTIIVPRADAEARRIETAINSMDLASPLRCSAE